MSKTILVTGGAGFIGSHVVRLFVNKYPEYNIINLDKLTYAGNLTNLKDVESKPNYKFVKMDICDFEAFYQLMQDEKIDGIIHLTAEGPSLQFEEGIEKTVRWYLDNQEWMDNVTSGDYQSYYDDMYKGR